ncbi:MAG: orotidine-5'-phosphate decarboxylase [Chitinophagaceae bacterium]|nr:orotidine-5'-phosphate decarboxylase [Chitinophagaceae bacterium]
MTRHELVEHIRKKKTYLCVGLDSDIEKLPRHLLRLDDAQFEFNKQIIDATLDHCVGYKINTAFYESQGVKGWQSLEKTISYIPSSHFTIADAKRGDIGNTSAQYAKAFFETMNFDAITVAPYMGEDSISPFLDYEGKWTIVLGLTSNPGSADFEMIVSENTYLFEKVLKKTSGWGNPDKLMFVIGATKHEMVRNIRMAYPDHFFLVPGVGAQGGSLSEISASGMNSDCGLLVNASRAVIFSSQGENFASAARLSARKYHEEMKVFLDRYAKVK